MKKSNFLASFCAAVGILLLNSCGSATIPQPTSTSLPIVITTSTLEPTSIPATRTPLPTRTITPTIEPTLSFDASCFNPEYAKEKDYDFWCGKNYGTLMSHDFSWGAFGSRSKIGSMIVTNNQGKEWFFYPDDFLPEEAKLVRSFILPEAWSEDNQYLYFSASVSWDGGGTCFWDFGPAGIFKLDVNTGEVETILPVNSSIEEYWNNFSISPNGEFLVYDNTEYTILKNLKDGEEKTIQPDTNEYFGDYIWNSNGDRLIFVSCSATPDRRKATRSEVIEYFVESGKTTTLFSRDEAEIDIVSEKITNNVEISVFDYMALNPEEITINLLDHKISTATPTQSPTATSKPEVSHPCFNSMNYTEAEFADFCGADRGILFSQGSAWGVFRIDNGGRPGLQIATRQDIKWTLLPTSFLAAEDIERDSYLWPLAWTPDNRYFFFTSNISRDGFGDCLFDLGSQGIYRLDTTNGIIEPLVPLLSSAEGSWFDVSISPDGRYLIYDTEQATTFTDLSTGKSVETPEDEHTSSGEYVWSSDGKTLSYTRCTFTEEGVIVGSEVLPYPIPGKNE